MPKVTVLMPVYNGEPYLPQAIDSILAQTFRDFELLIVDDGSTDSSVDIVQSCEDRRIRLLRNAQRRKLSGALNRGLAHARGEYVARMDADDISLPRRLEIQVAFMERHGHVGLCGTWVKMFGLKLPAVYRAPVGYEHIRAKALFDNPFAHPSVMLRKRQFDQHDLKFNGWYYPTEDFEIWSRAIKLFPCDNIGQVLLHYRRHPKSMTQSDWHRMDAKALPIVNRGLRDLGLDLSDEQLQFHRNIGREVSYPCQNRSELTRAEKWLGDLIHINRTQGVYLEAALENIIADVWFRLCFNASRLGPWVIRQYFQSPLTDRRGKNMLKNGLVTAAVLNAMRLRLFRHENN